MKQIILTNPGSFAVEAYEPSDPGPGEVQVRVHRIGVCGTDIHAFHGRQPFFEYPRVLGHELGVEVVACGEGVESLKPGDRCAVEPYLNCGHCHACREGKSNCCEELKVFGVHIDGGMRPQVNLPAEKCHKSSQLDYEQLALVETLCIGAHAVERARLEEADRILVLGAGPIGLGVLQLAGLSRAALVVGDVDADRLAFCRNHFDLRGGLNPLEDNFESELEVLLGGPPTVIFDATGNAKSMESTFEWIGAGGRIVFVSLVKGTIGFADPNFHKREIELRSSRNALPGNFRQVIGSMETGDIQTEPWISKRLPLEAVLDSFESEIQAPGVIKVILEMGTD